MTGIYFVHPFLGQQVSCWSTNLGIDYISVETNTNVILTVQCQ